MGRNIKQIAESLPFGKNRALSNLKSVGCAQKRTDAGGCQIYSATMDSEVFQAFCILVSDEENPRKLKILTQSLQVLLSDEPHDSAPSRAATLPGRSIIAKGRFLTRKIRIPPWPIE
jgi:hypothetical protein